MKQIKCSLKVGPNTQRPFSVAEVAYIYERKVFQTKNREPIENQDILL